LRSWTAPHTVSTPDDPFPNSDAEDYLAQAAGANIFYLTSTAGAGSGNELCQMAISMSYFSLYLQPDIMKVALGEEAPDDGIPLQIDEEVISDMEARRSNPPNEYVNAAVSHLTRMVQNGIDAAIATTGVNPTERIRLIARAHKRLARAASKQAVQFLAEPLTALPGKVRDMSCRLQSLISKTADTARATGRLAVNAGDVAVRGTAATGRLGVRAGLTVARGTRKAVGLGRSAYHLYRDAKDTYEALALTSAGIYFVVPVVTKFTSMFQNFLYKNFKPGTPFGDTTAGKIVRKTLIQDKAETVIELAADGAAAVLGIDAAPVKMTAKTVYSGYTLVNTVNEGYTNDMFRSIGQGNPAGVWASGVKAWPGVQRHGDTFLENWHNLRLSIYHQFGSNSFILPAGGDMCVAADGTWGAGMHLTMGDVASGTYDSIESISFRFTGHGLPVSKETFTTDVFSHIIGFPALAARALPYAPTAISWLRDPNRNQPMNRLLYAASVIPWEQVTGFHGALAYIAGRAAQLLLLSAAATSMRGGPALQIGNGPHRRRSARRRNVRSR